MFYIGTLVPTPQPSPGDIKLFQVGLKVTKCCSDTEDSHTDKDTARGPNKGDKKTGKTIKTANWCHFNIAIRTFSDSFPIGLLVGIILLALGTLCWLGCCIKYCCCRTANSGGYLFLGIGTFGTFLDLFGSFVYITAATECWRLAIQVQEVQRGLDKRAVCGLLLPEWGWAKRKTSKPPLPSKAKIMKTPGKALSSTINSLY